MPIKRCWLLEISVYRGVLHHTIAATFSCFVSLSDLNESNGIHLLILHKTSVSLGESKEVQTLGHMSRICMMCALDLFTPHHLGLNENVKSQ